LKIKALFFFSAPRCWDGLCAELPAEITDAAKEATPAKGCARLHWEPKCVCRLTWVLL